MLAVPTPLLIAFALTYATLFGVVWHAARTVRAARAAAERAESRARDAAAETVAAPMRDLAERAELIERQVGGLRLEWATAREQLEQLLEAVESRRRRIAAAESRAAARGEEAQPEPEPEPEPVPFTREQEIAAARERLTGRRTLGRIA